MSQKPEQHPPKEPRDFHHPPRKTRLRKLWEWTRFREKGLWDWLQLLFTASIPIVIALVGAWFTNQQAQDAALQAYLDDMGTLLIDEDLLESQPDAVARAVARAHTRTVLQRLAPSLPVVRSTSDRKGNVMVFLDESGLIDKPQAVIDISEADFSDADLRYAKLSKTDLRGAFLSGVKRDVSRGADLRHADLSRTFLSSTDLRYVDLRGAYLIESDLGKSDLRGAYLEDADLSGANLSGARVTDAQLKTARSLQHTLMPDNSFHE